MREKMLFGVVFIFISSMPMSFGITMLVSGTIEGIFVLLFSLPFAAVGIGFIYSCIRFFKNKKTLIEEGNYITTFDWEVIYSNVRINRVRQLCIIARYRDEYGRICIYNGEETFPPSQINEFNVEAPLRIYINLNQPDKYYMDYNSIKYDYTGY